MKRDMLIFKVCSARSDSYVLFTRLPPFSFPPPFFHYYVLLLLSLLVVVVLVVVVVVVVS